MKIEELPCPADATKRHLCGGSCGGCAATETCTGRSPVHPFGVCAPQKIVDKTGPYPNFCGLAAPCPTGLGCVTYVVGDAGVQRFADLYGFCIARDVCDVIAKTQPDKYRCE